MMDVIILMFTCVFFSKYVELNMQHVCLAACVSCSIWLFKKCWHIPRSYLAKYIIIITDRTDGQKDYKKTLA